MWLAWRISVGKTPLKESCDKQFYIVSENEFEEYSKFCDCLQFLPFEHQGYIIPQSQLLMYYMTNMNVEINNVEMYGRVFYVLNEENLHGFANWIEMQLNKICADN